MNPNIDLKITDIIDIENESDNDSFTEEAELDIPVIAQKDKIFKPSIKIGSSITGNVKDINIEELKRFLKKISTNETNYIITKEFGKDGNNPHLHFYIENTNLQIDTVKKKLREDPYFKKLKGKTAGGEHKYNLKYVQEKIQFYYIFKEVHLEKMTDFVHSEGFNITEELVLQYQHMYKQCQEHKKLSASNKFFYWISNKTKDSSVFRNRKKLIDLYLEFSVETNRAVINYHDCEKLVNFIIVRTDRKQLADAFHSRMERDYPF